MTSAQKTLSLGAFIYAWGYHPAAWLHPDSDLRAGNDINSLISYAKLAEAAKFDFLFFADNPSAMTGPSSAVARQPSRVNRWEPLTTITALSQHTDKIGFISTLSTSFFEPYNAARMFASIDHISRGRAGWNVVTSDGDESAYNFGQDGLGAHADRYARCEEFVNVVKGLWDNWEDDSLLLDRESGFYHHPDKLHELNHVGTHFKVRGPLNIARPPQGHPVISQAGGSDPGRALAARTADVAFSLIGDREKMRAFYQDVKSRLALYGRQPDDMKVMAGLTTYIGRTRAEAEEKAHAMADLVHPDVGLLMLSKFLEVDLWDADIDAPFPFERLPQTPKGSRALYDDVIGLVKEGGSLRQILRRYATRFTGNAVIGTPEDIADHIQDWLEAEAVDGFMLMAPALPASLQDFTEMVVPILQSRGIFRRDYTGVTLRDHLGLARPARRQT